MGGDGRRDRAQPAPRRDGRDRQPAVLAPHLHEQAQHAARRDFIVPRRIGKMQLRMPAARPRNDQIYFIGATNVPIDRLDPALIRPGRMGRHVWFRTPTKDDRLDILDLYIGKVSHDEELDPPTRRDEIARIMSGYSPGDDRAGDLDGADDRPPHRPHRLRLGRPRRGRDDARRRHRDRLGVHPDGAARGRDPRGRARRRRARLPDRPRVRRASRSRSAATRASAAITG